MKDPQYDSKRDVRSKSRKESEDGKSRTRNDSNYRHSKTSKDNRNQDSRHNSKTRPRSQSKDYDKAGNLEEAKHEETAMSFKPSPNLPNDNRYSMRNTVVGRYPESRKQAKRKVMVSGSILEDIIKATYLRDKFIEDYFKAYGSGRHYVISESKLNKALMSLGIILGSKTLGDIYDKFLDKDKELTAEMIDLGVEDTASRGIEEIHKSILEYVCRGVKSNKDLDLKNIFRKFDSYNKGSVAFEHFHTSLHESIPKLHSMDIYFLAKRYCEKEEDMVYYNLMLDEVELIEKGINPLMTWAEELAEYIVKAVVAKDTDFETLFKKFSPGKTYLDEESFIKAMQEVGVDSKFKLAKLKKFYYFIDDDKNQRISFREMESIVKTH